MEIEFTFASKHVCSGSSGHTIASMGRQEDAHSRCAGAALFSAGLVGRDVGLRQGIKTPSNHFSIKRII